MEGGYLRLFKNLEAFGVACLLKGWIKTRKLRDQEITSGAKVHRSMNWGDKNIKCMQDIAFKEDKKVKFNEQGSKCKKY